MQANLSNPAPKVSVIIPSYKTAGLIAACLDSVFAQTYSDFEAIVKGRALLARARVFLLACAGAVQQPLLAGLRGGWMASGGFF
jgi:hypothetical protein